MARYSTRDKIALLSTVYTQREIAARLGVSVRTVRRWKNEGVEPRRAPETLARETTNVHRQLRRAANKARAPLPRVPVPPKVRRVQRLDPSDPKLVRRIASDTVSYDVRNMSESDVRRVLRYLRDTGRIVRLIYKIPKGGTSLGGRDYPKGGQASTDWEADFGDFENDDIDAMMQNVYANSRRLMYIMVID